MSTTLPEVQRHTMTTKDGNYLSFFYCRVNNLVCVDLVAKDESGGNELLRCYMAEKKLLGHTVPHPKINTARGPHKGDHDQ